MCPLADNPAIERSHLSREGHHPHASSMPDIQPPVRPRILVYPPYGTVAVLDAIAAHEAAERDLEMARVMRIARVNRHAETES
jgi:hypothetical protein